MHHHDTVWQVVVLAGPPMPFEAIATPLTGAYTCQQPWAQGLGGSKEGTVVAESAKALVTPVSEAAASVSSCLHLILQTCSGNASSECLMICQIRREHTLPGSAGGPA